LQKCMAAGVVFYGDRKPDVAPTVGEGLGSRRP
jgi:hypothetical protein